MMFAETATVPSGRHSITSLFDSIEVPVTSTQGCFPPAPAAAALDDTALCRRRSSLLKVISMARQLSDEAEGSEPIDDSDHATAPVWTPGSFEAAAAADAADAAAAAAAAVTAIEAPMEVDQVVPGSVTAAPAATTAPTALLSRGGDPRRPRSPSVDAIFTVIDSTIAVSDHADAAAALSGSPVPVDAKIYQPRLPASAADRRLRKKASNRKAAAKFRQKKRKELEKTFNRIQALEASNAALQRELELVKLLLARKGH